MAHRLLLFSLCITLFSCESKINTDEILQSLKDKQTKAIIKIDGKNFYPSQSIFQGSIEARDNSFRLNITDQFDSNIILEFTADNWYKIKPIKRQIFLDNQIAASVMIGKLRDKVKRIGDGYLMTEGEISIESFSKEKCAIRLKGKIGKYEFMREPVKWNRLEGIIIFKKPAIVLQNVNEGEVYF